MCVISGPSQLVRVTRRNVLWQGRHWFLGEISKALRACVTCCPRGCFLQLLHLPIVTPLTNRVLTQSTEGQDLAEAVPGNSAELAFGSLWSACRSVDDNLFRASFSCLELEQA